MRGMDADEDQGPMNKLVEGAMEAEAETDSTGAPAAVVEEAENVLEYVEGGDSGPPPIDLAGETRWIRRTALIESPLNQRRRFNAEELDALAEDIYANGQYTPIIVRPISIAEAPGITHEIVDGARRYRACGLKGIEELLCIVRPLTDAQVALIVVSSDIQKEKLTPLEVANGLRLLREGLGNESLSQKDLARHLGKSEMWVSRKMQLTRLSDVWQALIADEASPVSGWSAQHFEYIAKFPAVWQDKVAQKLGLWRKVGGVAAAAEMNEFARGQLARMTHEELVRKVAGQFHVIKDAPFDTEDEQLLWRAGSCVKCPTRSDVDPMLFDPGDFGGENVAPTAADEAARCLNPICWGKKVAAFVKALKTELQKEFPNLVELSGNSWKYEWHKCKKTAKGAEPTLVVSGDQVGEFAWRKRNEPEPVADEPADEPAAKNPVKAECARVDLVRYRRLAISLMNAVRKVVDEPAALPAGWTQERLLAFAVAAMSGDCTVFEALAKQSLEALQLALLGHSADVLEDALQYSTFDQSTPKPELLPLAAEVVGVDLGALRKEIAAEFPYPPGVTDPELEKPKAAKKPKAAAKKKPAKTKPKAKSKARSKPKKKPTGKKKRHPWKGGR